MYVTHDGYRITTGEFVVIGRVGNEETTGRRGEEEEEEVEEANDNESSSAAENAPNIDCPRQRRRRGCPQLVTAAMEAGKLVRQMFVCLRCVRATFRRCNTRFYIPGMSSPLGDESRPRPAGGAPTLVQNDGEQ
jgi:hypothetical protein